MLPSLFNEVRVLIGGVLVTQEHGIFLINADSDRMLRVGHMVMLIFADNHWHRA